ncbi:hypothetical protein B5M42_006185 [Paenibacillus athensensis]|uniref:Uncharacterized protein n=1 Tax=Paenibacillus athensensis TaxID=1967502 RepID=A0A4Y8Q4M0_9BACL|nr:hypothetical protein [Paenibacillus athensensis]MCD1258428.1 hypothetical protein [Paenibacillus athensensis]
MKDRYFSTVETTDRFGTKNREFLIYSDKGKKPTIGDFVDAFMQTGLDVEIKDFVSMMFKPKDPTTTPIISLRVIRTIRDYSYSSYTRTSM